MRDRPWSCHRRDRGATLVEFAIAFPVLILVMMGIVDFGLNYSNKVQLADAARAAARAGSIANVGSDTTCPLRTATALSPATRALMCNAKARARTDPTRLAVKILYMGAHGRETTSIADRDAGNPSSLVVCMSVSTYSITGLLSPLFNGHFQHSRAVIKTGHPESHGGAFVAPGQETPMTAGGATDSWAFCKADDPTGME